MKISLVSGIIGKFYMFSARIACMPISGEPGGDWYTPEGYPRKPLQAHFSSLTDMCLALVAIPRSKHSLEGENAGVYSPTAMMLMITII